MQRLGRSGIDRNVLLFQSVLGCEGLGQLVGFTKNIVAAAQGPKRRNRFARTLARTERILIGVDQDGVGRHGLPSPASGRRTLLLSRLLCGHGEVGFGKDGGCCGQRSVPQE